MRTSAANLRFLSFVAASSFRNLEFKSRTRFIELLVVLRFRSSYRNLPRALTNFGIGPLDAVSGHLVTGSDQYAAFTGPGRGRQSTIPRCALGRLVAGGFFGCRQQQNVATFKKIPC